MNPLHPLLRAMGVTVVPAVSGNATFCNHAIAANDIVAPETRGCPRTADGDSGHLERDGAAVLGDGNGIMSAHGDSTSHADRAGVVGKTTMFRASGRDPEGQALSFSGIPLPGGDGVGALVIAIDPSDEPGPQECGAPDADFSGVAGMGTDPGEERASDHGFVVPQGTQSIGGPCQWFVDLSWTWNSTAIDARTSDESAVHTRKVVLLN